MQFDYITVETTGNAQDFGDWVDARHVMEVFMIELRGLYAGGGGPTTVVVPYCQYYYITFALQEMQQILVI